MLKDTSAPGWEQDYHGKAFNAAMYIDMINQRLIITDYDGNGWEEAGRALPGVAMHYGLGKVLFNVRAGDGANLKEYGFVAEGRFPGYFRNEDAVCYAYFTDPQRGRSEYIEQEEEVLRKVGRLDHEIPPDLAPEYSLRTVQDHEAEQLVELYAHVFTSYPSPLMKVGYVRQVMATRTVFKGIFKEGRLISAAAAEIKEHRAEITDCATLKKHRGEGLLTHLLQALEDEMRVGRIEVLFSLARAGSFGMNAVLHRGQYAYSGRFINNCHIGGRFEDMNLWVKPLNSELKKWGCVLTFSRRSGH